MHTLELLEKLKYNYVCPFIVATEANDTSPSFDDGN